MTRTEWQRLVEERLRDARVLLKGRRWSAAYYLTGYAVEAALKACIVKRIEVDPGLIFELRRFSEDCWTHDFEKLVRLAELDEALKIERTANKSFDQHWLKACDWSERSRYQNKVRAAANGLYEAVANKSNGVLRWVKGHW